MNNDNAYINYEGLGWGCNTECYGICTRAPEGQKAHVIYQNGYASGVTYFSRILMYIAILI